MMLVRGAKKFLDRVGSPEPCEHVADGALGDWYANARFWRPQTALSSTNGRSSRSCSGWPRQRRCSIAPPQRVAAAIGVDRVSLDVELATMQAHTLAKAASRQVLGVMNDFAHLAEHHRLQHEVDLVDLSLWLARVPCSPLYKSHVSPDRALKALLDQQAAPCDRDSAPSRLAHSVGFHRAERVGSVRTVRTAVRTSRR